MSLRMGAYIVCVLHPVRHHYMLLEVMCEILNVCIQERLYVYMRYVNTHSYCGSVHFVNNGSGLASLDPLLKIRL